MLFSLWEKRRNTTAGPIRPSENPLLVFISSRQDPEMSRARKLAINEVDKNPGMKVWAFEDAPASSEAARDRYITNAGGADLVIWLIGSTTTRPIVEEVNASRWANGRLLAFKLPATKRDEQTETLIREVSGYASWKTVERVEDLPGHIRAALTDEILRRYRDPAPVNHDLFLKQKYRESIADTKRLWTTLGAPEDVASQLAGDQSVGHRIVSPSKPESTDGRREGQASWDEGAYQGESLGSMGTDVTRQRVFSSHTGLRERSGNAGNRVIVTLDAAGYARGAGGREFGGVGSVADSAVRTGAAGRAIGPGRG